jgi:hypothetical protein
LHDLSKSKYTPEQKAESLDKFYKLVGDVYENKLNNGEYTADNYTDVHSAVDEVIDKMNDNQTSDDVKYANWTDDMKEIHKELTKDYKDGKFTFSDLNF